ncbi:MAG: twin transmembrane helix small protein [Pseudomonadota bacterium]
MDLMFKLPVILVLVIIVFSLFEGMYYLAKDDGSRDKTRVVRALTVRIVLSIVLFSIIMASYFFGWIEPHTIS